MKRNVIISLIFITLLLSFRMDGQETDNQVFTYNSESYGKLVRSVIKYPRESQMNGVEGVAIFELTVNPDSTMAGRILTKLDDAIEDEMKRLIPQLSGFWEVKGEPYKVYQALNFSIGSGFASSFKENVAAYPDEFNLPWLEAIEVRVMLVHRSERVSLSGSSSSTGSSRGTSTRTSSVPARLDVPPIAKEGEHYKTYEALLKKYNKSVKKGNTKKAYTQLNELIRFNPFDIQLLTARRELEDALGIDDFKAYDLPLSLALRKLR